MGRVRTKSLVLLSVVVFVFAGSAMGEEVLDRKARETLTPVELDIGDAVRFTRKDGQALTLKLMDTAAKILYTNVDDIPDHEAKGERGNFKRGRAMYHFTCGVELNGQAMTMERYVCSQESFYEPYVINGVRIWFDGVSDIFEAHGGFIKEQHGRCCPSKKARFALQDMTEAICPQEITSWYPDEENYIDVGRCFSGDDCWMGAYLGGEAHGGLDINMAKGTLLSAPIDFDEVSINGKRSTGVRMWRNGSRWELRVSHLLKLIVPDQAPLKAGTQYAVGASVGCWWHDHSHFNFTVTEFEQEYLLDPWILFWQRFETRKRQAGEIRACIAPLSSGKTGQAVRFDSTGSQKGPDGSKLSYYWTFGDGGWSNEAGASHTFVKSGIYPVTLTVDDGANLASMSQHIIVDGADVNSPALSLAAPDEPTFRPRPVHAMDVYGWPPRFIPHTLTFVARESRPVPGVKKVILKNAGQQTLTKASCLVEYEKGSGWANTALGGAGNDQYVEVSVDGSGLRPGRYEATVSVRCGEVINSPQSFRVVLQVPAEAPKSEVTIDDKDPEFYCTPYFWVGHRFHGIKHWGYPGFGWAKYGEGQGYNHFYLLNGMRARDGEFARFTPDLAAGKYEVWLHKDTPFKGHPAEHDTRRFRARVRHSGGEERLWVEPRKSRLIGTFEFDEGADGFVEILAEGSEGQVLVDAISFVEPQAAM